MTGEQREAFARLVREKARELNVFSNLIMVGSNYNVSLDVKSMSYGDSVIDIMEGNDAY